MHGAVALTGKNNGMRVDLYDYTLPPDRIAQSPVTPRDSSRLMVIHREAASIEHRVFSDVVEYLSPGDLLILNDTRVFPARLFGRREGSGGAIELLLLHPTGPNEWQAMVRPGRRAKPGTRITLGDGAVTAEVQDMLPDGTRTVRFMLWGDGADRTLADVLEELGKIPLPPYIKEELDDPERYQTVYADRKGSVAAPTAGLHFTPELLERIRAMGVGIEAVTLHVGIGTFRPVSASTVEEHVMHAEHYRLTPEVAHAIHATRSNGGKIVAVGTTTTRVLESCAREDGVLRPGDGWTRLFITPGYRFRAVDALITNFHLPRSTLLMLVGAFAGYDLTMQAYRVAVETNYRFYSLGDAMLIL